jgi:hypothetical protein
MRVHTMPFGALKIPMPPLAKVEGVSRLQGGLPPMPYRNACSKWASCPTKSAREPFASKQIRGEVLAERREA